MGSGTGTISQVRFYDKVRHYCELCSIMLDEDDNKTIFSGDLDSDERAGRDSGYERGKRIAVKEQPKRFGLARQRAVGKKNYDKGYVRIFGHE